MLGGLTRRAACCGVATLLIVGAVITTVLVILLAPPDDIETVERDESDNTTTSSTLALLSSASWDGVEVNSTLSLLRASNGSSSYAAISDFRTTAECVALNLRLLGAASSSAADGLLVVPVAADIGATTDFIEPLDADFDVDLYNQAALWCTTESGAAEQLGTAAELVAPTTLEGGSTVARQATLSGTPSYTVEGFVQILWSGEVVDGALVTTYTLRFEDIEVSSGPDVFIYLTTDAADPEDVDAEGSLKLLIEGAERGTFSFTGTFSQDVPSDFVSPQTYVAAVVWCDEFDVLFGSGLFEEL